MNKCDPSEYQIVEYEDIVDDPLISDDLDESYLETGYNDDPTEWGSCIGKYLIFDIELFIMSVFIRLPFNLFHLFFLICFQTIHLNRLILVW